MLARTYPEFDAPWFITYYLRELSHHFAHCVFTASTSNKGRQYRECGRHGCAALIVFAGFARTYFLKTIFGTPVLYPLMHVHGIVMTSWFLLFGAQTWLVQAHRKSDIYPEPNYQRGIGGLTRKIPDISWLADPFTGVEIIFTSDAQLDQSIEVIGGTSLATPMFSALWGIANQRSRHPLGNAAPYLYRMPYGAITDVDAVSSPENVTGTVTSADGVEFWDSRYLALPLQGQEEFYSALYNSPFSTRWFVLTFGTDSTLHVGPGFDTATGLGTPDGWNFVQAFGHNNW